MQGTVGGALVTSSSGILPTVVGERPLYPLSDNLRSHLPKVSQSKWWGWDINQVTWFQDLDTFPYSMHSLIHSIQQVGNLLCMQGTVLGGRDTAGNQIETNPCAPKTDVLATEISRKALAFQGEAGHPSPQAWPGWGKYLMGLWGWSWTGLGSG